MAARRTSSAGGRAAGPGGASEGTTLSLRSLKQELAQGRLRRIYLLLGTELILKREAVAAIEAAIAHEVQAASDLAAGDAEALSRVAERPLSQIATDLAADMRLRGAETVIVGIQPEVAFAMVQLGMGFEDVRTALDLEEGLALLQAKRDPANGGG